MYDNVRSSASTAAPDNALAMGSQVRVLKILSFSPSLLFLFFFPSLSLPLSLALFLSLSLSISISLLLYLVSV